MSVGAARNRRVTSRASLPMRRGSQTLSGVGDPFTSPFACCSLSGSELGGERGLNRNSRSVGDDDAASRTALVADVDPDAEHLAVDGGGRAEDEAAAVAGDLGDQPAEGGVGTPQVGADE